MFRSPLLCLLSITLLLYASRETAADSYRCGRKVVQTGDSSAAVLRVCGEPRHKDRGQERVVWDGSPQRLSVERWYYKRSSRSLEHIVMLYRGRVVAIAVGER